MFKFFKRPIKCVYAGPEPPKKEDKKDRTPMACVYAGPEMFDKKRDAQMRDVYAGPMPDEQDEMDAEELPTYPAQYEESEQDTDDSKMMLIYAAPGPEGEIFDFVNKKNKKTKPKAMDTSIFAGVYAGPMQMESFEKKQLTEKKTCKACGATSKTISRFCPECGAFYEVET